MARLALLAAFAASGVHGATELTLSNFDSAREGKSAFVKFLAPWWGHCKKMKPDWDSLAEEFKDSPTVLIADVDCTTEGKALCEKQGVSGYPTIKTFGVGDDDGESYEGGRDLAALRTHAESLGPSCSVDNKELCSEEQLAKLEKFAAMSQQRRDAKVTKLKNAIAKKEAEHSKVQEGLSAQYEASQKKLDALKAELEPQIKLMRMATPQAA